LHFQAVKFIPIWGLHTLPRCKRTPESLRDVDVHDVPAKKLGTLEIDGVMDPNIDIFVTPSTSLQFEFIT
jgi:hypothetical protein